MTQQQATARFKLAGKVYSTASLDEISLREALMFENEEVPQAAGVTWGRLSEASEEMGKLSESEAGKHPMILWMVAATIWASRKAAGESVTFDEAIDFKMKDLEFLPPTEDRKPGPTQARKGSKGPKASAAADEPQPADEDLGSSI